MFYASGMDKIAMFFYLVYCTPLLVMWPIPMELTRTRCIAQNPILYHTKSTGAQRPNELRSFTFCLRYAILKYSSGNVHGSYST